MRAVTITDKHGLERKDRIIAQVYGTVVSVQEWSRKDGKNERVAIVEVDTFIIEEVDRFARTPEHDDPEQPELGAGAGA